MHTTPGKPTDFDELNAREAAAYLGCGYSTFFRHVAAGNIPKPTRTFAGPRWVRCELDEARRQYATGRKRTKKAAR